MAQDLVLAFILIVIAAILQGLFTTYPKMVPFWAWENVWLLYTLPGLLILPWALVGATTHNLQSVFDVPASEMFAVLGWGFGWGLGNVAFGLGTTMVGNSLGFALILGWTAALGSVIPLVALTPEDVGTTAGILDLCSLGVAVVGLALLAKAGMLRDEERRQGRASSLATDDELLLAPSSGSAAIRPRCSSFTSTSAAPSPRSSFCAGLIVCLASGVLSAMLNLALAFGSTLQERAANIGGASPAMASNAVWAVAVGAGAVPNIVYSIYLLTTRGTWGLYCAHNRPHRDDNDDDDDDDAMGEKVDSDGCCAVCSCLQVRRGSLLAWAVPLLMGTSWYTGTSLYGIGAGLMGPLGKVLGWPIFIVLMVLTGNVSGVLAGEWAGASRGALLWLAAGLAVLVVSAAIIGVGAALD